MTLNEYLKHSGLRAQWLAEQIGVSTVMLNHWRNGKHTPSLLHAMKLFALSRGGIAIRPLLTKEQQQEWSSWVSTTQNIESYW